MGNRDQKESKQLRKEFEQAGYKLVRIKGDHYIFQNNLGKISVSIPRKVNKMLALRLRKELKNEIHKKGY